MTSWFLGVAAALLGAVLLWGLVSPRSQWRVLVGWSARDPDRAEPGDGVHGLTRLVCLLGLLALLALVGVQVWQAAARQPRAAAEPTAIERMWGSPTPRLVDRLVTPLAAPPVGLASGPIAGVQELERGWAPAYLVDLPRWSLLGDPIPTGIIGTYPGDGFTAYGISDLLVAAEGRLNCIPRAAAVVTTEGGIQIGVYWGLPGPGGQDDTAACDTSGGGLRQTVLVPIQLAEPLDGGDVVTFEGVPVAPVPVIDE